MAPLLFLLMPRKSARRRRLRKRQGPSNFAKSPTLNTIAGAAAAVRTAYEAGLQSYQMAKKIKQAASPTGRGRRMKKKDPNEWSQNIDNGVKYNTMNVSYKKQKGSKLTNVLCPVGRTYEIAASGNASGVGLQNNATAITNGNTTYQTFFAAINNATAPVAGRVGVRFNLLQTKLELEFANVANTTAEMDVYFLIDKNTRTTVTDANTVWSDGIADEANNADLPLENTGTPWLDPRHTKLFRMSYWSKKTSCVLTPGEKCKLTITFNTNRLIDFDWFENYAEIRGITNKVFVVQRGTLGDGVPGFAVTPANQSLTRSKIIWLTKRTFRGSILSTLPRVSKQIGANLPAPAALWTIDEDTGEPENAQDPLEYA